LSLSGISAHCYPHARGWSFPSRRTFLLWTFLLIPIPAWLSSFSFCFQLSVSFVSGWDLAPLKVFSGLDPDRDAEANSMGVRSPVPGPPLHSLSLKSSDDARQAS